MIEPTAPTNASLDRVLAAVGLAWSDLRRSADEIILFGSRAAGVAGPASDWDLLCVGSGRSISAAGLDLVWLSPAHLRSKGWLTGELAGHVACYGVPLQGTAAWTGDVACGPGAAVRKAQRLASRLVALDRAWPLLAPAYRRKHLTLVRRDLQRHALLAAGHPVPPTALLDTAWDALADSHAAFMTLVEGAELKYSFVHAHLAPLVLALRPQAPT